MAIDHLFALACCRRDISLYAVTGSENHAFGRWRESTSCFSANLTESTSAVDLEKEVIKHGFVLAELSPKTEFLSPAVDLIVNGYEDTVHFEQLIERDEL